MNATHDKVKVRKFKSRKQARGQAKRMSHLKKSKPMRRWLLKQPWIRPIIAFNYAAIKIQQIIRGFITRKRFKRGEFRIRTKEKAKSLLIRSKKTSARQLDRYMKYLDKSRQISGRKPPEWLSGGFSAWCAVRIQAVWRKVFWKKRVLLRRQLINQVASIVIQTVWRNRFYSKSFVQNSLQPDQVLVITSKPSTPKRSKSINRLTASKRIQLCWRSYCNRRIYKYFRDLIKLKLKGAPLDLLKSIIPSEAYALDKAAGVHVRFRLGGRIFPPKVYFKIFTHRPLCDVNAFAPRDYTMERSQSAIVLNNKETYTGKIRVRKGETIKVGVRYFETIVDTTNPNGTSNWYFRQDNNDWRPIASQVFENIASPPWFHEAKYFSKSKPFHFNNVHRKFDLEKERKAKKREWMMKLYGFHLQQRESINEDGQYLNENELKKINSEGKDNYNQLLDWR